MPARKPATANRELLLDLVAANRILAMHGVLDGYGHVSVRSDRKPDHFFMARSIAPQLVTVPDILEHGPDSEPIGDERKPYLERFIHGEMYRQRPDVMAVVHSHADSVIPFGITKNALRPVYHMASFLWSGAPVYEIRKSQPQNDLLIRDPRLGKDLAKAIGQCACVLMRGHGMTVVGSSIPEAVFRSVYTQANAKLQTLATQLGGPIEFLSDDEGRRATETNRATIERPWELWKARLLGPLLAILATCLLCSSPDASAQPPVSLTQSPGGHVVVHLNPDDGCGAKGFFQLSPSSFNLVTDLTVCGGTSDIDLGVVGDGNYFVDWSFIAGGFGTCCQYYLQSFSLQDGRLLAPPTANYPGPLSGLWWNPSESGWGIDIVQRGGNIFAAWFTYDDSGHPKWYVVPNCSGILEQTAYGECTGTAYEVNGPRFFGTGFQSITASQVSKAGTLQLGFGGPDDGILSYNVAGVARTVGISRQTISLDPTTPVPPAPPVDYTDVWWNPDESGWGLGVTQQGNNIFLAWYVYDSNGKPTWYVAPNCTVRANACSGTLYRTTGPAFGPTFPPIPQSAVVAVGSSTVTFTDPNNATFSYTVDGVTGTKAITRELF